MWTLKNDKLLYPVFIVGFPRTGTTLLYRILYRHTSFYPQICAERPEYNPLIETHFDQWFFRYALDLWCSEGKESLNEWFAGDSAAYTSFLLDCFRAFHLRAAKVRKCSRILEKTPSNIFFCEFMVHAFPNAKILCLRREPTDTVASFRRRRTLQPGSDGDWLDLSNDLDSFIQCWNQHMKTWLDFASSYPKNSYIVDYFHLTTKSHAAVTQVLEFLDEEMEANILAGSRPIEQTNWLDRYDSHIPVPNSNVWETYVTEDEASRLRSECILI